MSSINAEETAKEVSENIRKGKRVILGKIIKKRYAESTSKKPKLVTQTKSYQNIINPIVRKWEKERERITKAMKKRDLTKEQYRVLIDALDTLTKNIQILNGGKTSNEAMEITWKE